MSIVLDMSEWKRDVEPIFPDEKPATIREIMKLRDGADDAMIDDMFGAAAVHIACGDDVESVLADVFGLEPDYFIDAEFLNECF